MSIRPIANEQIERLLVGVPTGHQHIRAALQLQGETLLLQEATIANLCRAYLRVSTEPRPDAQALELRADAGSSRRAGFALHQLLETDRPASEVADELARLLERGGSPAA